ncbi:UNVERIFIED_CONTAM: hypothetical protein K2H54_021996 [Gekko kuhli]
MQFLKSRVIGAGMVVDWEQETGLLMTSGDVRIIRIWDTDREMKVQDIPTGADSCVTSLSCDSHRSLIVAGLGDGSVRVYDRRMALSECRVMTYREHTAWVVKAYLQKHPEGNIMSVRSSTLKVSSNIRVLNGLGWGNCRYWLQFGSFAVIARGCLFTPLCM